MAGYWRATALHAGANDNRPPSRYTTSCGTRHSYCLLKGDKHGTRWHARALIKITSRAARHLENMFAWCALLIIRIVCASANNRYAVNARQTQTYRAGARGHGRASGIIVHLIAGRISTLALAQDARRIRHLAHSSRTSGALRGWRVNIYISVSQQNNIDHIRLREQVKHRISTYQSGITKEQGSA